MTTLINTRPQQRAAKLTRTLNQYSYTVIEMPLLQLEPIALDQLLIAQFSQIAQADLMVAVSSSAVDIGMRYYQQLGLALPLLQAKPWLAIGRNTQDTLARYGIAATCPSVESSEGALQLPILQNCQQQSVVFWRGIGGRVFLMQQLAHQHCQIINMELYRRTAVQHHSALIAHIKQLASSDEPCWVIISSEFSWNQWRTLMQNQHGSNHQSQTLSIDTAYLAYQNLRCYGYLVLGERVTALVRHYFAQSAEAPPIIQLACLKASHIHQSIVNWICTINPSKSD